MCVPTPRPPTLLYFDLALLCCVSRQGWLSRRLSGIAQRTRGEDINDKFYTPPPIAKSMIGMVDFRVGDVVLEPCRGGGVIYNMIPDFCHIPLASVLTPAVLSSSSELLLSSSLESVVPR